MNELYQGPEYRSWHMMKQRCQNPKCPSYDYYGGRGIRVCDRWQEFENFYEDMGVRPIGTSLDRIDSNGDYCLANCRWATQQEQALNHRMRRDNSSGHRNISFDKSRNLWRVEINRMRHTVYRKKFKKIEDALTARNEVLLSIGG